ncbi:MAG: stalk domain-containing protein [Coriobacteriia bacterium]
MVKRNFNGAHISPEATKVELSPQLLAGVAFSPGWVGIPDDLMPEVSDQSWSSQCVAYSYSDALAVIKYPVFGQFIEFSNAFIYCNSKYPNMEGMYPTDAGRILKEKGCCKASIWDGLFKYPKDGTPPSEAFKDALNYRIANNGYITSNDEFRAAVANPEKPSPVCMTIPIYENFKQLLGRDIVPYPGGKLLGYHEVLGYQIDGAGNKRIQNSWGKTLGDGGRMILFKDFPVIEMHVLTDIAEPAYKDIVALAVGSKLYKVDFAEKEMDTVPVMRDNRVFVPVRFVAEALGATVVWNEQTEQVHIVFKDKSVTMQIGWQNYTIDGEPYIMDVAPYVDTNDRTMVPVRFVAEAFGCKMVWEEQKQTVRILSNL